MRSFDVPAMKPAEFAAAIRVKLAAREFDRYVSIGLEDDRLAVELRWMGTTRFDYLIMTEGEGFRAELVGQRFSPFHAVFRDRFEGYFEEALAKVGARVT